MSEVDHENKVIVSLNIYFVTIDDASKSNISIDSIPNGQNCNVLF